MHAQPVQWHGTPCLQLQADGASALVALHGAQLLSWRTPDGRERLFLSERARFHEGSAIRGGIPVIFPQFGARGSLRKHGFARLRAWRCVGVDTHAARFELAGRPGDGEWPHAFVARVRVELGAQHLGIGFEVENRGAEPFTFTAALHSYLRVDDCAAVVLHGLQGLRYEDSAAGGTLALEQASMLRVDGELDRVYAAVSAPVELHEGSARLQVTQHGFGDVVVWNPGAALAARIDDLAAGEYRHFVCVEAAQVLQSVRLPPRACWRAGQGLRVMPRAD